MKTVFSDDGWEDYCSWAGDRRILLRINRMIREAERSPGEGIGKPERLTANLSGFWSRRIDGEHRLVYKVQADQIVIVQARYHWRTRTPRQGGSDQPHRGNTLLQLVNDERPT